MSEGGDNSVPQKRGWLHRLVPVAMLAVFCAALWAIQREIKHFQFADRVIAHLQK